ncbi:BPI fold-containing family B member 1 [Leptonychotes weddellii]|uniref:BPI fold-containing family B member 1 n=1 Tax=Leptonychotes weddellii TaxID=9713 RepID=A0A7F8QVM6_LEPWE|nr:BPI fold-containing family B member 1 [Leptonychotes weddellii]
MAGPFTFTLLCGLLAATLAGATLNPPAVLSLGREIIKERLTQELKDHNAISILQQLPLLSTIREKPARGIPIIGSVVNSILNHIIWLKVTSANVLQLQVDPSDEGQGLAVKIPLDMVAGLNTPLVKTIVEIHMETEVQAIIQVNTREGGHTHLVLDGCSNIPGSLRISLLHTLSFLVNSLAHTVMSLLVPALPELVKTQLCPVIQAAFEDMHADLLHLVRVPVSLGSDRLEFDLLSPAIKGNVIQLELGAKLLDSHGDVTKWFNKSAISLTVPYLDSTPFSLTVRQDVVNAAVTALLPPEEIVVLLDYVLPELAHRLKSNIKVISEQAANQLGPTQMVKIQTRETPELLLDQGSAKVAQLIVLEVFATNEAHYPFFTLGIEASSEAQFYTKDDRLMLNFNEISSDWIHLMNSSIGLFRPELLKNTTTEILVSVLLPNENSKLRSGIPISMVKAWGFKEASFFLTKNSLVVTPASS